MHPHPLRVGWVIQVPHSSLCNLTSKPSNSTHNSAKPRSPWWDHSTPHPTSHPRPRAQARRRRSTPTGTSCSHSQTSRGAKSTTQCTRGTRYRRCRPRPALRRTNRVPIISTLVSTSNHNHHHRLCIISTNTTPHRQPQHQLCHHNPSLQVQYGICINIGFVAHRGSTVGY